MQRNPRNSHSINTYKLFAGILSITNCFDKIKAKPISSAEGRSFGPKFTILTIVCTTNK